MTKEDKELLLKDLCARLPYGVKVKTPYNIAKLVGIVDRKGVRKDIDYTDIVTDNQTYPLRYCQPYLRPMSSMTEEEKREYDKSYDIDLNECANSIKRKLETNDLDSSGTPMFNHIDWLNAHHFDYRGLIEKGLAIKATKENNPYKE